MNFTLLKQTVQFKLLLVDKETAAAFMHDHGREMFLQTATEGTLN